MLKKFYFYNKNEQVSFVTKEIVRKRGNFRIKKEEIEKRESHFWHFVEICLF